MIQRLKDLWNLPARIQEQQRSLEYLMQEQRAISEGMANHTAAMNLLIEVLRRNAK